MFSRIDTSSDRRVSLEEFKKAVPIMNNWGITITNPEKTFKEIDKDGAGMILFEEFCTWAAEKNLDLDDDDDIDDPIKY
jgi:Ca2+-binding EF-hand superfamily protein